MCDYPENEINIMINFGLEFGSLVEENAILDNFGKTGTVYRGIGKVRLGNFNGSSITSLVFNKSY